MRLKERCAENVDVVHDMPAKPEMFIHGFIFSEKTLYKQGSKSQPLRSYRLLSVHEKCQRCKPGRTSSPQMKGMHAVTHFVHGFCDEDARTTAVESSIAIPSVTMKQATFSKTRQWLCDTGSHNQCPRDCIGTCEVSRLGHQCLVEIHASGTE